MKLGRKDEGCRKRYKSAIKTAKNRSWLDCCQNIENIKDSAKLSKILTKELDRIF